MMTFAEIRRLFKDSKLPVPELNLWVSRGIIEPAVRGSIGGGGGSSPHLYSYKQVLGLAEGAAFGKVVGTNVKYGSRLAKAFEAMSDATLYAWLQPAEDGNWDSWQDESVSSWLAPYRTGHAPFDEGVCAEVDQLVKPVLAELRRRLGIATPKDRVSEPAKRDPIDSGII
jgi:hypothetical protein